MRVLHLLDPAVLRQTDYRCRTLALMAALRDQGVQTVQLASPDAGPVTDGTAGRRASGTADASDESDGAEAALHVYRTASPPWPFAMPSWKAGTALPSALCCSSTTNLSAAAFALRLRQVARLTRPDLIHVHAAQTPAPAWQALAMWMASGRGRLPLVAEGDRRGARRRQVPLLERWALARTAALAASSLEMRASLRSAGLGCSRIAVIPPATELAGMPRRQRQPPGLEGAPLLAFAGQLAKAGGIDLLLAALETVRQRHPGLRLVVAGGGTREDELAQRIAGSAARGHVILTGVLSARRAADVLPRADIAVFPALPGSDAALGPSRHLLNAMAQGCAIVASDIAVHRELLVHGHNAILFRAGDRRALAKVLLDLLEWPERRQALGREAAAFVAARHSWMVTAGCYRRLYETVLAERIGRRG
jgi:glycosyltransferase involved in cell wall biosynthesis